MSSLWTPSGERPVGRPSGGGDGPSQPAARPPVEESPAELSELSEEDEALAAEMEAAMRQLAETPAAIVVANHAIGMFELARLHLSQDPPNFAEAQLAIDAMAALVDGLGSRLADAEATLVDALAQ